MTAIIAIVSTGRYAVMVADGRVTTEGGEILSDKDKKTYEGRGYLLGLAGSPGPTWEHLGKKKHSLLPVLDALRKDAGAEWVGLTASLTGVSWTSAQAPAIALGTIGAVGSGADLALGYVLAKTDGSTPKTASAAAALLTEAVKSTYRRYASCGGEVRVLTLKAK